jgi:hypothetical protein
MDAFRDVGAFGPGNDSRPNWLTFVRRRPAVAAELLGELRYARATREIANPGAWMMGAWQKWGRPDR